MVAPNHCAELADGWGLWRWARLRGAGFSVEGVAALASPGLAAAADRLVAAEHEAFVHREKLLDELRVAMRGARGEERTRLGKALKRVRSKRPQEALEPLAGTAFLASVEPLIALESESSVADAAFEASFNEATGATEAALREAVADPRFHEAVVWQNRAAWANGCEPFSRHEGVATSRTRKQHKLIANYLQRYCTKNDTIGFFGPNGWARVDPEVRETKATPGPTLLASRSVYFEYWAIDALAAAMIDDELKLHLLPRRSPNVWVDGDILHHPIDQTTELHEEFASILSACDGVRTATEIAAQFGDDAYAVLTELEEQRLITWTIEIPTATARPELYLRALLDRAGPAGERGRAMLTELEQAKATIAAAAGDPARLESALTALELTFVRLTSVSATRNAGQMYAARTLVYEDCRRDFDLTLGDFFLRQLAPPLALVLQSARWYTHEIATRYSSALREIFATEGEPVLDYLRFWKRARDLFPGKAGGGIVDAVRLELEARWERILAIDPTCRSQEFRACDLTKQAADAFAAPHPGWPSARHHSPDILLAGSLIVIGEIHVGMNTAAVQVALEQHQDPASLIRAREADLPEPGIAPVWSKAKTRADFYSQSSWDYELETGETRSARPRDHVIAIGTLVIEDREGRLVVHPRGVGPTFDLIPFLEHHLIAESFSRFDLLAARPHTPRITIDDVVVARERWRFACAALPFLQERLPAKRFVHVRKWAKEQGFPRFVFLKSDAEVKPTFVDFDSPILVEMFIGDISRATEASVTEMLPMASDCWLADAEGNRYTSELRMIATDPQCWTR